MRIIGLYLCAKVIVYGSKTLSDINQCLGNMYFVLEIKPLNWGQGHCQICQCQSGNYHTKIEVDQLMVFKLFAITIS